jgi:hypothetical protein
VRARAKTILRGIRTRPDLAHALESTTAELGSSFSANVGQKNSLAKNKRTLQQSEKR